MTQDTKKRAPEGRLWQCLDCGKVWDTKTWFDDLLEAMGPEMAKDLLMCKGCNGKLEEIKQP